MVVFFWEGERYGAGSTKGRGFKTYAADGGDGVAACCRGVEDGFCAVVF